MNKTSFRKSELRRMMREKLRGQSALQMVDASRKIVARLSQIELESESIAVFLAQPREPNVDEFARALLRKGARVYAPHGCEDETYFGEIAPDWSNILTNAKGWREPRADSQKGYSHQASGALKLETVLIPGLAFDIAGNRVGQGGGWYDRALEMLPDSVLRIGVCFDFQIVEAIPQEAHDQCVTVIVTEQRAIRI